jgi:hypothetical protein
MPQQLAVEATSASPLFGLNSKLLRHEKLGTFGDGNPEG